jgi:MFS family permease
MGSAAGRPLVLSSYRPRSEPLPLEGGPDATGRPQDGNYRHLRRSLELITLGWFFGSVWQTAALSGSPLTIFVKGLGGTPFQFGVLAALPYIASLLSLPASLLIERTGQRKRIFLGSLYFQRLLWFPIALVPLWVLTHYGMGAGGEAVKLFLILIFVMHACGAAGGPAWVSWMADVVPDRLRGKYFSRRRQWGLVSAIPTALFAGWLLDQRGAAGDTTAALRWCAILFMCAAVFGLTDIHLFRYLADVPKAPQRGFGLLKALGEPLRNRQFLWFAAFVGTLTFAVAFMQQFTTLFLLDRGRVGVSNAMTQLIVLVVPMAAQFLMLPVWGTAVDRMGKKPVLALAGLGLVPVALGWCLLGAHNLWLAFVLSAAQMVLWTGVDIANFNAVLEMAGSNDTTDSAARGAANPAAPGRAGAGASAASSPRATGTRACGGSAYVAVNSVIVNLAGCLGGLSAGLIAQGLSTWQWAPAAGIKHFSFYDVLFVLSAVLRLAAVAIFLPFMIEPAARPAAETLRFMTTNLRRHLSTAAMRPLRLVGLRKPAETYARAA